MNTSGQGLASGFPARDPLLGTFPLVVSPSWQGEKNALSKAIA